MGLGGRNEGWLKVEDINLMYDTKCYRNSKEARKNEEKLRNLQDIFKCSNIQTIGIPEGEEEEQKMENLFEQIMKENVPYLAKEIDF